MSEAAMSETRLRSLLCELAKSLFDRGFSVGSAGNISARLPDGGYLMTPTNSSLGRLDPARLSPPLRFERPVVQRGRIDLRPGPHDRCLHP